MSTQSEVVSLDDYRLLPEPSGIEATFLVDEAWSWQELRDAWNAFVRQWAKSGLEPVDDTYPTQVQQVSPGWHIEVYTMGNIED